MFDLKTYRRRRETLKKNFQSGILLFLGNDESPMNYPANTYLFRQDSSFLYYWGLDLPGLAAVIDVDAGREILFGNELDAGDIVWTGPKPTAAENAARAGVDESAPFSDLKGLLEKAVQTGRPVHFLPQYRGENKIKLGNLLEIRPELLNGHASLDFRKAVIAQRSVKEGQEVEQIEFALDITREMHTQAIKMTKPGLFEREVAGRVEGLALSRGGRLSFPIIFSVHGETLHNEYHGNRMNPGDLVVHDSGAEAPSHYAGDITRTFPVKGKFSAKQREIYQLVLKTQLAAIDAIRPNVSYRHIHLLAARVMAAGLKELGLMKGDTDKAVQEGAHALFFPHGLGHMMGLDVHDMEGLGEDLVGYDEEIQRSDQFGLAYLRLGKRLQPGYVLTVEPGIYFIPELIRQWKAAKKFQEFIHYEAVESYRNFGGIRIEDDVLVTETGHRVLGKPIPKAVDEVEALMQNG
ncbi:xaa-Pro aminopeptidase [bacterium BMS3Bbin03]|nr:xaa-Pro aminopeptidase [bacterium BMS3Bbin03]